MFYNSHLLYPPLEKWAVYSDRGVRPSFVRSVCYTNFRRTFLSNYKQQDLETLQEAFTHHTVACKPHIHFLFAVTFYALTLNMKFFVAVFSTTIYSRILKLYRKLPHIMLQRVSHFRGRAISTSCLPNTLTFQALTLNMKFFVTLFSTTIYSRILKLYRKLPHIILQRVSHFRVHAISTSCLPNTLTFYALTLYMKFFVALFSATIYSRILKLYRKLPHIILQRVSHFRGRAISTSCLPNTLTFYALTLIMKFFVTLFSTTIYSRILKLYRKLPHIILQRVSHFRGHAISTSCLPNTLTFYTLTLYMTYFVALEHCIQ